MNDRLTKSDWIRHGLRTLARSGSNGLKVGPMAARLKVTRGSFYWHFEDIADFRTQLLGRWQERMTEQVIRNLEARQAQPDRLKDLMRRGFRGKRSLDRAVRAWAAEHEEVAAAVASVDARRVDYMAELLVSVGVERHIAATRATFLYWAHLGQPTVMAAGYATIEPRALDEISELLARA